MANWKKTLTKVSDSQGRYDQSIEFKDFINLLQRVGYALMRYHGSHLVFAQKGWKTMIVQPRKDGKTMHYQVRDLRTELERQHYG